MCVCCCCVFLVHPLQRSNDRASKVVRLVCSLVWLRIIVKTSDEAIEREGKTDRYTRSSIHPLEDPISNDVFELRFVLEQEAEGLTQQSRTRQAQE